MRICVCAERIHAGLMDREMDYHYVQTANGRSYAESLNLSWQLGDHCPRGGGLHVVPGSVTAHPFMYSFRQISQYIYNIISS